MITLVPGQFATGSGTSTATATFANATNPGNLLLASVWTNNNNALAIAGWTQRASSTQLNIQATIFEKIADGSETAVTVTNGNTGTRLHIFELSGQAASSAFVTSSTGGAATNTTATTAAVTTTSNDDFIFTINTSGALMTSPTVNSPFTLIGTDGASSRILTASYTAPTPGSYQATFNWTPTGVNRNATVVYKVALGGNAKVYNGSSFVAKPAKVWNGSSWVQKPVKRWTGSAWVRTTY